MKTSTLVAIALVAAVPARAQVAESPVILGTLAGAGSAQRPPGVRLLGTDLGWTFSHRGELFMLFGDSWSDEDYLCSVLTEGLPRNDDAQATLPPHYTGGVPKLSFVTEGRDYKRIEVSRDGVSLNMGANRTPLTGFSDGVRAIGVFQSSRYLACDSAGQCPAPFSCVPQLGQCQPSPFGIPQICDVERQLGCYEEQTCEASGPGFCVDASSSQPDPIDRVPLELELAVPRGAARWDSRLTWRTNKFLNVTARVEHGTLLLWGRPGFFGGPGRVPSLYLLAHDLPFREDAQGKLVFRPRYFAGLDRRGAPRWSARESDAAPLALDGQANGDPSEALFAVNQMAITWLDAPIRKWVMLYGGGPVPDGEGGIAPGVVALRFSEHAWGPWSPPQPHLLEGAPDQPNTPLGPGGVLYHPACVDQGSLRCARTDPVRPAHILNEGCAPPEVETDVGYFYAPNIIDAYTERNARGGLDVYWNLSAWNPYRVHFLRSRFFPH